LFDGTDLRGRPLKYRQLTVATGPAHSPIAPIEPAGRRFDPQEPVLEEPVEAPETTETTESAEQREHAKVVTS